MKNSKQLDATTPASGGADGGAVKEASSHESIFEEGEGVIANHKGYFYLAKVEKVEFKEDWKYLIHYMGWNKRQVHDTSIPYNCYNFSVLTFQYIPDARQIWSLLWDEWLGIDHLLKRTEENLKKVSHDTKKTNDKNAKMGHISQIKLVDSSAPKSSVGNIHLGSSGKKPKNSSLSRKRKREQSGNKEKDNDSVEKLVNLSIPPTLKKQLVDDFELINQMDKLVKLPRSPNVDAIIEKYRDYREKKDSVISESVGEVLSGLCVYFNKALPVLLLYNKERQQYQEAIVEASSSPLPSAIYGAEHLLRLFVKLPALLNDLDIEEETLKELQQTLLDFLKFLQKNQAMFFLSSYLPEDSRRSIKDHD